MPQSIAAQLWAPTWWNPNHDKAANIAMTGSCDEPIPWESTIEWNLYAVCCCD